jgi:serine/threonine protein kinase
MPGRETFALPDPRRAGSWIVVKRYTGGEARDAWYDRLKGLCAARTPARREWENLVALAREGLPVPRALAFFEEPGSVRAPGRGARSAVVMERVPVRAELGRVLAAASADERASWLARLAELVARFHARGWYHRDLYLHQVVVDAAGRLVLLDVGRARRERAPRRRWHVKDLAALWVSAPAAVERVERECFLARYLAERGFAPGARRGWLGLVEAKAARLAAHRPEHVDLGDGS